MNRAEFFAFEDAVVVEVPVKEMNTVLHVRSLSAGEKAEWEYEAMSVDNNDKKGHLIKLAKDRMMTARERLVELASCNPDGSKFFEKGDAAAIGRKNSNVISTLYDAAAKLSGITKEDLEEIAKNSERKTDGGVSS